MEQAFARPRTAFRLGVATSTRRTDPRNRFDEGRVALVWLSSVHRTVADAVTWAYGWDARSRRCEVVRATPARTPRGSVGRCLDLIADHGRTARDAALADAGRGGHDGR